MAQSQDQSWRKVPLFRFRIVLIGFLMIAGFFLWEEHEAHILAYLPLILFLGACVGMHFFMHGGHGGHVTANQTRRSG